MTRQVVTKPDDEVLGITNANIYRPIKYLDNLSPCPNPETGLYLFRRITPQIPLDAIDQVVPGSAKTLNQWEFWVVTEDEKDGTFRNTCLGFTEDKERLGENSKQNMYTILNGLWIEQNEEVEDIIKEQQKEFGIH